MNRINREKLAEKVIEEIEDMLEDHVTRIMKPRINIIDKKLIAYVPISAIIREYYTIKKCKKQNVMSILKGMAIDKFIRDFLDKATVLGYTIYSKYPVEYMYFSNEYVEIIIHASCDLVLVRDSDIILIDIKTAVSEFSITQMQCFMYIYSKVLKPRSIMGIIWDPFHYFQLVTRNDDKVERIIEKGLWKLMKRLEEEQELDFYNKIGIRVQK